MKAAPVSAAATVSHRINGSSNQPSLAPSSITYCMESRKTVIRPTPHQSTPLARERSPWSKVA